MNDALKGYLALAGGLTEVTKARATAAAKALVAQGEAAAGQVQTLADDLIAQSRSNREAVTALVKFEVDKALGRVGLASADEVTELTTRVRQLEAQLREARAGGAAKAPAAKAPAKAPAKKTAAKKAPAKKAAAKKTPAKAPTTSTTAPTATGA